MSDEQILDYNFHMPAGVKEVKYKTPEEFDLYDDPTEAEELELTPEDEFSGPDEGYEDSFSADENVPYPPDYVEVVSQIVRTLPGGGQVVDVVVELPDLEDGSKYDLRMTKA